MEGGKRDDKYVYEKENECMYEFGEWMKELKNEFNKSEVIKGHLELDFT
jgi:hypothetical protein